MKIIAHRGAPTEAPENTLPAVQIAWQHHADAVEIDVHVTRDHHTVVIHDPTTLRTAGIAKSIAQSTLKELRKLDVGQWQAPNWAGTPIPTLQEIVDTIPDGKQLLVEMKFPPPHATPFIELCKTLPNEKLMLIGFSLEILQRVRVALPHAETAWVAEADPKSGSTRWRPPLRELIRQAAASRLHALDLDAGVAIDNAMVKQIHAAGLGCLVWTVDSVPRARELAAAGIDGLTTNVPAEMRRMLPSTP